MSEKDITTYLTENPRMIGALFTLTMLLASASSASAGYFAPTCGP
ncbi:DUF7503 family protein [Halarchaeum sp. P4]